MELTKSLKSSNIDEYCLCEVENERMGLGGGPIGRKNSVGTIGSLKSRRSESGSYESDDGVRNEYFHNLFIF